MGVYYTLHLVFAFRHWNEEMRESKISDGLTICIAQNWYPTIHEIVFIEECPHQ